MSPLSVGKQKAVSLIASRAPIHFHQWRWKNTKDGAEKAEGKREETNAAVLFNKEIKMDRPLGSLLTPPTDFYTPAGYRMKLDIYKGKGNIE